MESDLTSLIILARGHARDLRDKIYRMSKAALVRGVCNIVQESGPSGLVNAADCSHYMHSFAHTCIVTQIYDLVACVRLAYRARERSH
eukprot:COSAG02_NODE_3304_length_6976_cov_6.587902_2_plen_88_part_00